MINIRAYFFVICTIFISLFATRADAMVRIASAAHKAFGRTFSTSSSLYTPCIKTTDTYLRMRKLLQEPDADHFEELFKKHGGSAAVNAHLNDGVSLLHSLAGRPQRSCLTCDRIPSTVDHVARAQFLIKQGADRDAQDVAGDTPLHYAVRAGDSKMVQMLLQNGARADIRNRQGYLPAEYNYWPMWVKSAHHETQEYKKIKRLLAEAKYALRKKQLAGYGYYAHEVVSGRKKLDTSFYAQLFKTIKQGTENMWIDHQEKIIGGVAGLSALWLVTR